MSPEYALEFLESLGNRPEMYVVTREAFAVHLDYIYKALGQGQMPWEVRLAIFEVYKIDRGDLIESADRDWARQTLNIVKEHLASIGVAFTD